MPSFFYKLGRVANQRTKKWQWVWHALTGSEVDRIRAEAAVGEQMFAAQLADARVLCSDESRTLAKLLERLTCVLRNRDRQFEVVLIEHDVPNAWVLPGGFITMSFALYEMAEGNEGELAFVLAHEMAHIIRGHALQRLLNDAAMKSALRLVRGGGIAKTVLKRAGVRFYESSYSKDQEFEADDLAIKIIEAADFSRSSAVHLFSRFHTANERCLEDDRAFSERLEGWFASHPTPQVRINRITSG